MTTFVQANMHRSRTADALLSQLVLEKSADAVIISEPYRKIDSGTWIQEETGTAAIWLPATGHFPLNSSGSGDCFVWASGKNYTLISCYLTPSDSVDEFQRKMNAIEDKARDIGGNLIIAGDFNAKATEWGMPYTNSRGRKILNMMARLEQIVANVGNTPTFRRPNCAGTIPDITLVSEGMARTLTNWKVLEDYTGSDHQYILFKVQQEHRREPNHRTKSTRRWNVGKLNTSLLVTAFDNALSQEHTGRDAISEAEFTMHSMTKACNIAMPKIGRKSRRKAVYWWSDEIAQLRLDCLRARRRFTRARRRGTADPEETAYKLKKKALSKEIACSKKNKWEEIRADINTNPWGLGYKIVMKKLGARRPPVILDSSKMEEIVNTLFPTHMRLQPYAEPSQSPSPQLFTEEELKLAVTTLKNNKAPGPDGIPSEILKIVAEKRPHTLLKVYNACLIEGIFPERWKKQKLVLISKGKGNPDRAEAYRPLCLLDTAGKLFERLIKSRINKAIEEAGGLSARQHGFRPGRSTLGAINDVLQTVEAAQTGNHHSRRIVLLATLDVRNAFNSARWEDVIKALQNKFAAPHYLSKMMHSYLENRLLIYDTNDGRRRKEISSGAAQGSILGPDLWNMIYDDILQIEMPDDTHLVAFADDVAAVITTRNTTEAQWKLNQVMRRTQSWLEAHGLKLATEKTELLLLTRRHIPLEVEFQVGDRPCTTQRAVNYLGVRLDPRLTFSAQIQYAAEKAGRVTASLSRLMANIGGPKQSKRNLLAATVNSILLYGCELWADTLNAECRRKIMASVQKTAALRVASAYRTVSEPAVLVISGNIPIDLLARERKKIYSAKLENLPLDKKHIREQTIQRWQERWDQESRARWTRRLIPNLEPWVARRSGEVNYYLTQMLTGHGYFRKYLHRMNKADQPSCLYGDAEEDDAEHTFFRCNRWREKRSRLQGVLGTITPENVIDKLMVNDQNWMMIAGFCEEVLREKKVDLQAQD